MVIEVFGGTVSATTGRAIHNESGTVNFGDGTATSEKGHAIYTTAGEVNISGGTVSANDTGRAAVYGSGGKINITGGTVLTTHIYGYAVYITSSGAINLGGSPTITGRIYSYPDKLGVLTTGDNVFAPGQNIYAVCFPAAQYTASKIAVTDGRNFLKNFTLNNVDWALTTSGPHLAVTQAANRVSFYLNGGAGAPPSTVGVAQNGKLYNKPATNGFTKTGYVNDGEWYIDPTGNINSNLIILMRDDYSVGWNGGAALRISVNGNYLTNNVMLNSGGSNIYTLGVNGGDEVAFYWVKGSLDDGCAFAVYYAGTPLSAPFDPESGAENDPAILLSRQYESLRNTSNGTLLGTVTVRTSTPPATDTKFEFGENGTTVSGNITLYLKWIEPSTITFDPNGGELAVTSAVTVGSGTLPSLPTPTKGGYDFAGWFTAKTGGTAVTAGTTFSADATIYAQWTQTVAVLTPIHTIPPAVKLGEEAAVIAPVTVLSGEFTAGPNPAAKQFGIVNFYRQGRRVTASDLRIYDAAGNVINRVKISDNKTLGSQSRRKVGAWDLKDKNGRLVPEGTYLVKGKIKTLDGKNEKVSVVIGVR